MKKTLGAVVCLLVALSAGCTQTRPELRVEEKSETPAEPVRTVVPAEVNAAQTEQDLGGGVKVVTAEPAVAEEKNEEDVATAEDKAGAVALKMEY